MRATSSDAPVYSGTAKTRLKFGVRSLGKKRGSCLKAPQKASIEAVSPLSK